MGDQSVSWFYERRAEAVLKSLAKNRMGGEFVPEAGQVAERVMARIPEGASVALGGSLSTFQTGVVAALRASREVKLIDRFAPGLTPEETMARLRQGLLADVFVAGVNAITEQGELVFVDASCTRVGPILFGPRQVILVAGCNKIVPNLPYAQERIRHFVAPANAKRLGRKTPCALTGQCLDCQSDDRICNATVVIHKQADPKRLHMVLVGESLGL